MPERVFVPASFPAETADPLTWPRITAVGDDLHLLGRQVRRLHSVYVVGWQLLNDCAGRFDCFGMFCDGARCWRTGQEVRNIWNAFWMDDVQPCVYGVELAIVVRTPSGATAEFVARGGAAAVQEILRRFSGEDDLTDCSTTLFACDGAINITYSAPSPSTRVHRVRRNLVLSDGWETYREVRPALASGLEQMLMRIYPDPPDREPACDDPWEPDSGEEV